MLLNLDRPHRLAYVLGEVLELTGDEAGAVLEISPVAFRKRLSRARDADDNFVSWEVSGAPCGKPAVVLHGGPGQGSAPNMRVVEDAGHLRSDSKPAALLRALDEFARR
jgi:hypothetical protein